MPSNHHQRSIHGQAGGKAVINQDDRPPFEIRKRGEIAIPPQAYPNASKRLLLLGQNSLFREPKSLNESFIEKHTATRCHRTETRFRIIGDLKFLNDHETEQATQSP